MTLSRKACERLDQYLNEMRASMPGSTPMDVAEIEQDIRDHVSAELADRLPPVSVDELGRILQRLGSPRQWAADNPPVRTPSSSPGGSIEDRLAYASVGSMVVFLAFPPLLLVSWLLARWTLARIEERGEAVGSRQWLLYPPIVIVAAPLAVIGLLWAFAPFAELGGAFYDQRLLSSPAVNIAGAVTVTLGGLGVYWMFLGAALAFGERLVRLLFYPFAEGFHRRHGWWLSAVGAALTAASAATFVFLRGR